MQMYVARIDSRVVSSDEVQGMLDQYEEKFGERFIAFNYADFPGSDTQCAGEMYRDTLKKALEDNKPYHIVSHRYDEIDH